MIMTEDKMKYYYPLILDPNEKGNSWAFYYTDNRYFLYMGGFKDGHPNIIQTFESENGEKRDVIFLSEDGIQYISIPSGTVQTRGIYGFVK